ncbi:hypothetical protein R3P38DRAFT_3244642 [Favolaschia claudopus]|uniref:Uncharacterized protein n=1 Tax=Favolaschia claudopus TaxID=2862362 RepID=A0AAV9Z1W5_9AGAR
MAKSKGPKKQQTRKRKRTWTRIEKKDRRNLRLWAEGARETILQPHLAGYMDALERGWRAERDYVRDVCNEFHARISWRLGDDEEPEEPLPEYDPLSPPEAEELDEEELGAKRTRIETLNARINRWLKYRAKKIRRPTTRDRTQDAWGLLLSKLAGIKSPPKARQGFQQYMVESYESEIKPVVEARWKAQLVEADGTSLKTGKGPNAPFRAQVAREMFKALSEEEQDALVLRAKSEAAEERTDYLEKMKGPVSREPKDRQECIDNLGTFMTEVLRGVHEYTGLSCFAVFGGPIPMYDGDLRTLTVAYGRNQEPSPSHFPQWEKARFGRDVLDFMREWLKTAYTPAQCAEAAMPKDDEGDPLARAKYRIDAVDDWDGEVGDSDSASGDDSSSDSSSASGSDSGSDSTSDSENDSGAERDIRARKKKGAKEVAARKERAKAAEKVKRSKAAKTASKPKATAKALGDKGKGKAKATGMEIGKDKGKAKEIGKDKGKAKEIVKEKAKNKEGGAKGSGEGERGTKRGGEEPAGERSKKKTRRAEEGGAGRADNGSGAKEKEGEANGAGGKSSAGPDGGAGGAAEGGGEAGGKATDDEAARTNDEDTARTNEPLPPACPSDAPEYFAQVYAEVSTTGLGEDFNALLTSLSSLEKAYKWAKWEKGGVSKGLRTTNRPQQVQAWVQAGRGSRGVMGGGAGPTLSDTQAFGETWWGWWRGMQPVWRKPNDGSTGFLRDSFPAGGGENWMTLRFPGPNGALSLIASLFWWGKRLREKQISGDGLKSWEEAVVDVTWMLRGLAEAEGNGGEGHGE